jgi:Ca2+-binding EF-hand superfamily protein
MFDKNNDGTINYEEFSVIVKDMLKKEMLNAGDLLEELRKEFRAVCNPITRSLGKEQVK